jgi:hypothetical protein
VCVTLPSSVLSGEQQITIRVSPPAKVITTWVPDGGSGIYLMTQAKQNPGTTNDYSFAWPTQKYLDASGVLRVHAQSMSSNPVDTPVTLSNGNSTDFQHSPPNWATFLPRPWSGAADPVIAAVGDAAANEVKPNKLAAAIDAADPAIFLYLGDVYELGSFTENRNHYGASALDDPSAATLFGAMAAFTQPTIGNHEVEGAVSHFTDWQDYWHGRPDYTFFDFAGVRFLDLDSNIDMRAGSAQYQFVRNNLPQAPNTCIVAYWHIPTLNGSKTKSGQKAMWKLLATSGGDLVLNGHVHNMTEYVPLDDTFQPSGSAHMRELVSGAGGHSLANPSQDPSGRIAWSLGKTTGFLSLTLEGGASGGVATSIDWIYRDIQGDPLAGSAGSVSC